MSDPHASTISIVIPTLGDADRLRPTLESALSAIEARGFDPDEVIVVDDSGAERAVALVPEILSGLETRRQGSVHVHRTQANSGFAEAVMTGAKKARGALMLVLQDDAVLRAGALDRLAAAMKRADVYAAGPRIVLAGEGHDGAHALDAPAVGQEVRIVDDRLEVREVVTDADGDAYQVTFLPSTALMVRRKPFVEDGGFDPLLAPFSWEDVDLGLAARRRGKRVVRVPEAVVLHHVDLPSVWTQVPERLANAVVERNRLLTRWKHLASRTEATEHLVSLWRSVIEAGLAGDREALEAICLAFERLGDVTTSRTKMQGATLELMDVLQQ